MPIEDENIRLDKMLVKNGRTASRDRAITLIKQGGVRVNGQIIKKPGTKVSPQDKVVLEMEDIPWISRGGLKLEAALKTWDIDPQGLACLDVGASIGGFTDVLLHFGARKVYAVDVGKNQLADKLKNDPRVVSLEKINFKKINENKIKDDIDMICIDVSYISLTRILEKAKKIIKEQGVIIALVKPQFEMENKSDVGKGVVKDKEKQEAAVEKVRRFAKEIGLEVKDVTDSPILGGKGNKEFLMRLEK
jgi:23S rRNA (cytidine1920-2'-O)/16S rRNA (cytidine1409-2'-O)-methyltransferase